MKNIVVFGAGYVGLANSLLLSEKNNVLLVDINETIVNDLSKGLVHIDDKEMQENFSKYKLTFQREVKEWDGVDLFILALPTNYDEITNNFDTSLLDKQLKEIRKNSHSPILIKSTIPIGYTSMNDQKYSNIVFSPEFLREGNSLKDVYNPSRIILGSENKGLKWISDLFKASVMNSPECIYIGSKEAESVKLFSNTYLAMRVAFVNELDSFAKIMGLNSENIIKGVSLDTRIGDKYFTPSSGYGGYCLPKDSKQLMQEFNKNSIPNDLLEGIVKSNDNRKDNLVRVALENNVKNITIKGIGHKPNVKNYRNSQNLILAHRYMDAGINVDVIDDNFKGQMIDNIKIK